MRCHENGIEHRLTKVKHPWTSGQVERMNRTTKEATVKRFHYDDHRQFEAHLTDVVAAYNFGRRLKTQGAHTLRVHLQMLDFRARTIQARSNRSKPGTEHLAANDTFVLLSHSA